MRVEVTVPELAGLGLSSSAHASLDGLQDVKSLNVELSGSSSLNGTLTADQLSLQVNGSSFVQLSGSGSLFGPGYLWKQPGGS